MASLVFWQFLPSDLSDFLQAPHFTPSLLSQVLLPFSLNPVLWIFLFPPKTPLSQLLQSLLLSGSALSSSMFMSASTFFPSPPSSVRRCVFFPSTGRHSTWHRRCLCLQVDVLYTELPFVYYCTSRRVCCDRDEFVSGLEIWLKTWGDVLEIEHSVRKGINTTGKAQAKMVSGASSRISVWLWIQHWLKLWVTLLAVKST